MGVGVAGGLDLRESPAKSKQKKQFEDIAVEKVPKRNRI